MKAVILAGGKGRRLGKLEIPKPMIKIGGLPVLEHQINLLKRYKITDIILLTGHMSKTIEDYFQDGKKFGVNITYFVEKTPLGTTGGLKEIENQLKEDFMVLYGDTMMDINLKKMISFHKEKNSVCTLLLHPNDHPYDSDLVEIDKNKKIIKFHPKPHDQNKYYKNLVSAALYVISPKMLKHIEKGTKADFGRDIFPKISNKTNIYGYITAEYIKDMGTPERLEKVAKDFLSGKITRLNNENKRKAIFIDRDGTINKQVGDLSKIEDFELFSNSGQAIKLINASEFLAILVTNQPCVAKGFCSINELEEIHKKMETLLGKQGSYFDAIYYCPHHPEKGHPDENPKYKIKCECRKPKIAMIKEAEKEFNINIKNSFIIGDHQRDIECGKNAGLITIGVRTGKACKDPETNPDHIFDDILQAVEFIIHKNL